ncbi:DUF1289 domain-containing protein [Piscinibacter sp. Jin2]|uniref:DUF1289 domain-containing protein n=1 Tax=Aquariibacter lacus TaxID=2801332 RepID=A0A9X0XC96_9BURK|nr:DUF1289 domain-containing protein [Piscinibacter lacus]MBL0718899.1 DUF1289 domain-containing protein [Piscinibacter lacus]
MRDIHRLPAPLRARAAALAALPADQAAPSPCIQVCRIDPLRGLCIGCLRSLDEIAAWPQASPAEQRALWARLPARVATPPDPAGSRQAPPS